ncbi:MAG: nucleoside-diphosphate kinase [Candidatus Nanoarchaeia archaeon]
MIQRTLVLIKPDGVERGLVGEIIHRYERKGLKIVAMKMIWIDKELALKHYNEDITKRRGEKVRKQLVEFVTSGPIIAMVLEGVDAIENVRTITGDTEPKSAKPGTIRGDFSPISYRYADSKEMVVKNTIHASSSEEDAEREIKLWFSEKEIHQYENVHEKHTR